MDDLISKQSVLDLIKKSILPEEYGCRLLYQSVEQMPSAQPNLQPTCNQLATDCISRQAAIDAINAVFPVDPNKSEYASGIACGAALALTYIKQLPSAQPEPLTEEEKRLLKKLRSFHNGSYAKLLDKLVESAHPEAQWIPCSKTENLPIHEVLCCDEYGEELIGWLSCEDDQWLCESGGEMMYDPIAWRELPEPWRGEE